ncbi:MAG: cytochrome c3 family protein, partial [bacterium]
MKLVRQVPGLILPISIVILIFMAGPAFAEDCSTAKCHSSMGKAEFVHVPVAVGQCTVCHKGRKANHPTKRNKGNDFKLRTEGKDLCFLCHDRNDMAAVVHGPIAKGACTVCHDPHQSNNEKQLKKGTTSLLCFSCHEDNMTNRKVVHGPVAAGDCNICHNPHSSDFKGMVEFKGSELCFLCHLDRRAQFEQKYKHKPAAENCALCHDTHSSDYSYMLKGEGQNLCFRCHKDLEKQLTEAKVTHGALEKGICTVCHTAHASDFPRQLKTAAKQICFTCHKEMAVKVKKAEFVHGPVKQDDCYACHNPHGSGFTKVLKKAFPAEFYIAYATESYALCFDCHNQDISIDQFTTTLTGFRNGDQNLHFLHVNREKGISCKACHEVHAGSQAKHIR